MYACVYACVYVRLYVCIDAYLPHRLQARGFSRVGAEEQGSASDPLPGYRFRDDAYDMWDVMHAFASSVVQAQYASDPDPRPNPKRCAVTINTNPKRCAGTVRQRRGPPAGPTGIYIVYYIYNIICIYI